MDKAELITFLKLKTWNPENQDRLVAVWNELRGESLGKVTRSAVRTPCRIRQMCGSLLKFAENEM
jgi:hypothetical protein